MQSHLDVKLDADAWMVILGVMTNRPSDTTIRAWTRLTRAQHHVLSHVEAALKRADLPPLSWYDVLLELRREPVRGLRPFEIERQMLLPQYGLSRLLDRIEKAGLLLKQPCEEDGRGQCVSITESGRRMLEQMWPVYAQAIEESLGSRLREEDTLKLVALLEELIPASNDKA